MTRIIYSVLSLLMLTMGVVTFDLWGNALDIPVDYNSDEMKEMSWFPVRRTRHDPEDKACNCDVKSGRREFGLYAYPRLLVSKECVNRNCIARNKCREIPYHINVSTFIPEDDGMNGMEESIFRSRCTSPEFWKYEQHKISLGCIPVIIKQQK